MLLPSVDGITYLDRLLKSYQLILLFTSYTIWEPIVDLNIEAMMLITCDHTKRAHDHTK